MTEFQIEWNCAGTRERIAVVELCGWCNKKGNATPTGKRIAATNARDLTPAAVRVLKRHGIIVEK